MKSLNHIRASKLIIPHQLKCAGGKILVKIKNLSKIKSFAGLRIQESIRYLH